MVMSARNSKPSTFYDLSHTDIRFRTLKQKQKINSIGQLLCTIFVHWLNYAAVI